MTVTGWQLMALKSAQRGGIDVPARAFARVKSFINLVGQGSHGGDYRYQPDGPRNYNMVAEGMFCRQLLGPDQKKIDRANGLLQQTADKFNGLATLANGNAQTPAQKKAAATAKTLAENASQQASNLAANTRKFPREKLPAKTAGLAANLTNKTLPEIETHLKDANATAAPALAEAKSILNQTAKAAEAARIDATHPRMRESARIIQMRLPNPNVVDQYYWYYGSLAMHQNQGEPWEKWNRRLQPILLNSQVRGGRNDGSWNPVGRLGVHAGRPVTTALITLSLEVYYRYLPLNSLDWMDDE